MSDYTITDLPLSCSHRTKCHGAFSSLRSKEDLLQEMRSKLNQADARIDDLETGLTTRTASAELARAQDAIKKLQKVDVAQRRTIDNLSGETYELRRLMRESKAFDMAEVQTVVSESLLRYRLAIEEDR